MSLKILIFPFIIIMALVLGIGYIQPDYVMIQQKLQEKEAKEKKVASFDTLIGNIAALNKSLDGESENFVKKYFPDTLDQGRVIDNFNFLSAQTGVALSSVHIEDVIVPEPVEEEANGPMPLIPTVEGAPLYDPLAVVPYNPRPKAYVVKATSRGSYENLKSFFDQVAHMDRFNELRLMSISSKPLGGQEVSTTNLEGIFEAEFKYMPVKPVVSAVDMPLFNSAKLDLTAVQTIRSTATRSVPTLDKGVTGKPNPFE